MLKRIDTHRHLGGSVPESFFDVLKLGPVFHNDYRYGPDAEHTFEYFFSRFKCLDEIDWTESKIELMLDHVSDKINSERYKTILSFSCDKYLSVYRSYTNAVFNVADYILEKSQNIKLLLGVKYENVKNDFDKIMDAIESSSVTDVISGIDFIGDERQFHKPLVERLLAAMRGKYRRAHVAERQPNFVGIQLLKDNLIDGVAHGIHLGQFDEFFPLIKDRHIFIDMALTSNLKTGTIRDISKHPIYNFMNNGCLVTIGTDDPEILDITLDSEFEKVSGLDWDQRLIDNGNELWNRYN